MSIVYNPMFSKITGNINSGLLLSYCTYLSHLHGGDEFLATDKEMCDDLCMGLYELKHAKKVLSDINIVSIVRKGIPAKTYYKLNIEILTRLYR